MVKEEIVADQYHNGCPRCERRLVRTPQGRYCPYCGYDFSTPPEDLEAGEYFTGAECGVFGLIIGLELGVALGVAGGGESPASLVPWTAGGGGVLGAVLSGWLANRIAPPLRRGLRRLLLSACAAGILVFSLASAGLRSVDAIIIIQVGATAVVYLTVTYLTRLIDQEGNAARKAK